MYQSRDDDSGVFFSAVILACVLAIPCCGPLSGGCDVSQDDAAEILEKQGFSNVETTGYAWLECGKGDTFSTAFTATNAKGEPVEGVVCCGWLKSCTVRW